MTMITPAVYQHHETHADIVTHITDRSQLKAKPWEQLCVSKKNRLEKLVPFACSVRA